MRLGCFLVADVLLSPPRLHPGDALQYVLLGQGDPLLRYFVGRDRRARRGCGGQVRRAAGDGRLGDRSLLAACIGFLEAHEPDLIAVSEDIGVKPEALLRARAELE